MSMNQIGLECFLSEVYLQLCIFFLVVLSYFILRDCVDFPLHIDFCISFALFQDSFVSDARGQPSRDNDIEMGTRVPRSSSDMGMEGFNKQVICLVDLLLFLDNPHNCISPFDCDRYWLNLVFIKLYPIIYVGSLSFQNYDLIGLTKGNKAFADLFHDLFIEIGHILQNSLRELDVEITPLSSLTSLELQYFFSPAHLLYF